MSRMQSQFRRQRRAPMSDMNVVPYIDVMLVLLVIFMITAPMLTQGIEVQLPRADADPLSLKEQQPLIVTVKRDGSLWLQTTPTEHHAVSMQNLPHEISSIRKARNANVPVLVNGDRDVGYGRVVEMMGALQQGGVEQVGLLTELPDSAH